MISLDEQQTSFMKARSIFLIGVLFILGTLISKAQLINQKTTDANNREKLLGLITKEGLAQDSFAQWFNVNYESYRVDTLSLKTIQKRLKEYRILAFIGTWCGDSRREVPRFYKILETIGYPMKNLTMVAVDNTPENYKKSPTGEEKGYDIKKVPTFIFIKDGEEINRIVESPKVSLEEDIKSIVMNANYMPHYKIVPID